MVSASDDLFFPLAIGSFGLFKNIDEMLALSYANQLAEWRRAEGRVTHCANCLAGVVQDCYGLYESCHVVGQSTLRLRRVALTS